ncbi:MAG: phosphopyruvate hydratase [Clostridia bacterium]|nr:phosphopyruvate hydratase [Clostridia bacterium]
MKIQNITGREILDSRGNPTVEATVILEDGTTGTASVPSGASTGMYEAVELRDGEKKRYGGKGVRNAVSNVNTTIRKALIGRAASFYDVDRILIETDGTENKSNLGANATLAVSLACARAAARSFRMPLYRYLGGTNGVRLPVPLMNILNGGAHADNNLDVQEFMIVPIGFDSFTEALRAGTEIYHALGSELKKSGKSTAVGDEGGFAPNLADTREAIETIIRAIRKAGYDTDRVKISLDAASSEWASKDMYYLPKAKRSLTREALVKEWESLAAEYPIFSIEDGAGEEDGVGWELMTRILGNKIALVGDDYFVTNPARLLAGIAAGTANAVLVKPNQIGTLTETLEVIRIAKEAGYRTVISHRSGETGDSFIADLAVATNAGFIKTGAPCRYERVAKYNRLLKIEDELGRAAVYGEK